MHFSPVIYVIDDSEIDCLIMSKLLHKQFPLVKLEVFHSVDEAIAAIKRPKSSSVLIPSLILLDINMPVKNGWEFLEEYRLLYDCRFENIKVIIFTSSMHPDDPLMASKYEMVVDFMVKPIQKEQIEKISMYF